MTLQRASSPGILPAKGDRLDSHSSDCEALDGSVTNRMAQNGKIFFN